MPAIDNRSTDAARQAQRPAPPPPTDKPDEERQVQNPAAQAADKPDEERSSSVQSAVRVAKVGADATSLVGGITDDFASGPVGKVAGKVSAVAGPLNTALGLPQGFDKAKDKISEALATGERNDIAQASAATTDFASSSTSVVRGIVKGAAAFAPEAGEAAAVGVLKAAGETGASALGKAAGRFVPGANIAIAALDTATAVATLSSDASVGKKVASVVSAAGSIAAATNIPVVSQVGGAVGAVAGFVGGFLK